MRQATHNKQENRMSRIIRSINEIKVSTGRLLDVSVINSMSTSESPTDYVLGLSEVLENVEARLRRNPMVSPPGVYVPEALDDRGEVRHPLSPWARRFSLRGAVYASSQLDGFAIGLDLDRQTMHEIACHYIAWAADCVRWDRDWPERTLPALDGTSWTRHVWLSGMDDLLIDGGPEQVFDALALVGRNIENVMRELEEHHRVLSPWQFGVQTRYDRMDWDERARPTHAVAMSVSS